jgi:hypothetical protein
MAEVQRYGEHGRADVHLDPRTESCLAKPDFPLDVIGRIAALQRIGEPMDAACP